MNGALDRIGLRPSADSWAYREFEEFSEAVKRAGGEFSEAIKRLKFDRMVKYLK